MKRWKKLGLMVLALALLAGGTLLARNMTADISTEEDSAVALYALEEENLASLSWTYRGETVAMKKEGDSWALEEDDSFPVSQTKMKTLVNALSEVTAEMTIEKPEDLAQYGLEEPLCSIMVDAGDRMTFEIGTEKSMDGLQYCSVGDGKVYLIGTSLANTFSIGLYDMVQKESIPSMSQLESMIVTSEVQDYEIDHIENSGIAYTDSYEWFLKDGDGWKVLDNSLASGFANKIRNLTWQECVNYNAGEEDLAACGLDAPAATVEMHYIQSTQVETNLTDDNGEAITETVEEEKIFTLEIGDYKDNSCYARIAGSPMVYLVSATLSDNLLYMDYDDLRPEDVLRLDDARLTEVEVAMDGETAVFEKVSKTVTDEEEETTIETVWMLDGEETELEDLLQSITGLSSAGFADSTPAKRTPEFSLHFRQENDAHPTFELVIYPYDSSYCLVTLDGESTVFISRYDAEQIRDRLTERISSANQEEAETE